MENNKLSNKRKIRLREFALSVAMEVCDGAIVPITDPLEVAEEIYNWLLTGERIDNSNS